MAPPKRARLVSPAVDGHFIDMYGAGFSVVVGSDGSPWDVMLNQVDIAKNSNKFFVIQLLEKKGRYLVWTRWGRVGYGDQSQSMRLPGNKAGFNGLVDLTIAEDLFCKKFKDKTKNDYRQMRSGTPFEKKSGKYDMVEIQAANNSDEAIAHAEAVDAALSGSALPTPKPDTVRLKSELDPAVLKLMQLIFDEKLMESTVTAMEFDVKKMPLGKISKGQVAIGMATLKSIETEINKASPSRSRLEQLSSTFYTQIPHYFGYSRPPIIASTEEIATKMKLLDALGDIEVALSMVKGGDVPAPAEPGLPVELPAIEDGHFAKLNIGLQPLAHADDSFKMVTTYVANTHGSTHSYKLKVDNVYEVAKDLPWAGGKSRNRALLWHGSRLTNWPGILANGLKIAPPEAPVTGYMFGKGLYFADVVTKSANYCFSSPDQPKGLLLLCEVALGKGHELYDADPDLPATLPKTCASVRALGKESPDPKQNIRWQGMKVPLGTTIKVDKVAKRSGYTLQYNEFVVYNTEMVRPRFLVEVNFEYGSSRRF